MGFATEDTEFTEEEEGEQRVHGTCAFALWLNHYESQVAVGLWVEVIACNRSL